MITIWHNPRCSKSRAALKLIEDSGQPVTVRRYLDDAPSREELAAAHRALGTPPMIEMMRRGEAPFKKLGLSADSSDDALLDAMAAYPILIERPIVFAQGAATIGRPPEAILPLL